MNSQPFSSYSYQRRGPRPTPTSSHDGAGNGDRKLSASGRPDPTRSPGTPDGHDSVPGTPAAGQEQPTPQVDPHEAWQLSLGELALQMPTATYDTWMRDTFVIAYEDGEFLIGVPNTYARDWLENRLRTVIKRTLSSILRRSVQVTFRVWPRSTPELSEAETPPLYRMPQEEPAPYQPAGLASSPGQADYHFETANHRAEPGRWDRPASSGPTERQMMYSSTPLNPRNTFETFVVGSHNRLAHAAALAVADQPGQRFNPLFVYGGVGLGKTHLLHAVGHRVQTRGLQVLYCSSEQFTNDLISAIRNQSTEEFRNKYREVDLLLIDDIQFIAGKESTQEEFFHTFNHLHAAGRQVVISSDRPPKAIATLEARLRSRFEGGLQADISPPDFETRVAILQSKATGMGVIVDLDVLMLVAERVDNNIRELEGTLNRLIMQAPMYSGGLNRRVAEEILHNLMPQRRPRDAVSVVRIVAEHFNLCPEDLTGRVRTKDIAIARQVAMYLLREDNDLSLPTIGDLLGGRDHSTVRYGVEKIQNDLEKDEALRREINALRDKIYAPPGSP